MQCKEIGVLAKMWHCVLVLLYHLKFDLLIIVCYIHPHLRCDHLPGLYLAVLACMRNAVMNACCHLFRMALKTCVWSMHVGILVARARLYAFCSPPSHTCSLVNACMLHDHMLSSKPNANDKVLIQAKGAVRAINRIRSCTNSPVR